MKKLSHKATLLERIESALKKSTKLITPIVVASLKLTGHN